VAGRLELLLCALAVLAGTPPAAADNLPLEYRVFPSGTRLLTLRYTQSWGGDFNVRGETLDDQFDYDDQQGQVSMAYYGGEKMRYVLYAALPFERIEASSDVLRLDAENSGVGDGYVVLGLVPIIRERYHLALSGWLIFPTGEYDSRQPVNPGLNVWSARIEGNWTWRPRPDWTLEVTSGMRWFEDNRDFGPMSATLERTPRGLFETHLTKQVRPGRFLSLDYYYHWGSETTVNGVERDDAWDDHALQLTAQWKLKSPRVLTFWYRNDFVVRNGPENQTIGVRLMQFF
jgi:hypothetical protein